LEVYTGNSFLAGRTYDTVLRPSVTCLSLVCTERIVAKRCVL